MSGLQQQKTIEQQKHELTEKHDEYITRHANVFEDEYMPSIGDSSYVKTLHLKKPGKRKGFFSRAYASLTKGAKQKDIQEINRRKLKNRKGLHGEDENGTFSNPTDVEQVKFFNQLKDLCKSLCDLEFATPEFIKAISSVDEYITAENYDEQQEALNATLTALDKYVQETSSSNNDYETVLCSKAAYIKRMLEDKTNGTLEIPEEQKVQALQVSANPSAGILGTYSDVSKFRLFPHEPSPNDVKQRTTSDCYMMSSLCSIAASQPDLIKRRMKDNGDTVTVQFFEKGTTKPVYITVKKEIPTYMFIGQKNAVDSLWVQMIEKAFAVYYGNASIRDRRQNLEKADDGSRSYAALDYQDSFAFLSRFVGPEYVMEKYTAIIDLTTSQMEKLKQNEEEQFKGIDVYNQAMSDVYSGVATRLHEEWKTRLDKKEIITVGILGNVKAAKAKGYHVSHAYSVLKVFDKTVEKDGEQKVRRFVRLRDPYGAYTSDYNEKKKKTTSTGNSLLMLDSTETMGTFDVEWNEFLNTFDHYSGCIQKNCGSLLPGNQEEEVKEQKVSKVNTENFSSDDDDDF